MSLFIESFPKIVQDELNDRQNLISKSDKTEYIDLVSRRGVFARLSSAVMIDEDRTLAQKNILQSGLLEGITKLRTNITSFEDNNPQTSNSKVYNNYFNNKKNRNGIVPMPGITSISIQSLTEYGSLKSAHIEISCWDVNQLNVIEKLYMRPGYTLLLEYGWKYKDQVIKYFNEWWMLNSVDYNRELIPKLYENLKENNGNYNFLCGKITNFSWNYDAKTSEYKCSTDIISVGEILHSLRSDSSYNGSSEKSGITIDNDFKAGLIIDSVKVISKSTDPKEYEEKKKSIQKIIKDNKVYEKYGILYGSLYELKEMLKKNITVKNYTDNRIQKKKYVPDKNTSEDLILLPLKNLCNIINDRVCLYDENKKNIIKITTKQIKDYKLSEEDNLCIASELSISTNYNICSINNPFLLSYLKSNNKPNNTDNKQRINLEPIINQYKVKINTYIDNLSDKDFVIVKNDVLNQLIELIDLIAGKLYGGIIYNDKINVQSEYYLDKYFNNIYFKINDSKPDLSGVFGEHNITEYSIQGKAANLITEEKNVSFFKDIIIKKILYELIKYNIKSQISYGSSPTTGVSISNVEYKKFKYYDDNNKQEIFDDQGKIINLISEKLITYIQDYKKPLNILNDTSNRYIPELQNSSILGFENDTLLFTSRNNSTNRILGNISNIYVNIDKCLEIASSKDIENQDQNGTNHIYLRTFLENLLKEIQNSLGNVNNFSLFAHENYGIIQIVDIGNTSNGSGGGNEITKPFQFEIANTKSILRSVSIESKIFPEMGTIISISAQATPNKLGFNNGTLVSWNEGIKDAMIPVKDNLSTSSQPQQPQQPQQQSQLNNVDFSNKLKLKFLISYIRDYIAKSLVSTNDVYSIIPMEEIKSFNDGVLFFKQLVGDGKGDLIIPNILSLTLDGIGGIVIGNIFTINKDILPISSTSDKIAYIVTGLSESITNNNEWITTIKSQFILLNNQQIKSISDLGIDGLSNISNISNITASNSGDVYDFTISDIDKFVEKFKNNKV